MKKSQKQFILFFTIFVLAFILKVNLAFAANVSFDVKANISTGDKVDVGVNADTGGALINSAELVISYDSNLLSFSGYSDTNSVIKLWIDPPHAENGQITLSGIIPGGVSGLYDANKKDLGPVPLVHLLFVAKKPGATTLSFVDSKILEQDGKGTALPHGNISTDLTIKNNPNYTPTQDQTNTTVENTSNGDDTSSGMNPQPNTSDPLFWVIIALLICGVLGYKLLKSNV